MASHSATDDWKHWILAFILIIAFVFLIPEAMKQEDEDNSYYNRDYNTHSSYYG